MSIFNKQQKVIVDGVLLKRINLLLVKMFSIELQLLLSIYSHLPNK